MNNFMKEFYERKVIIVCRGISEEEIIKLLKIDSKPNLCVPILAFVCLILFILFVV